MYLGRLCPFSAPEVPPLPVVPAPALRGAAGSCCRHHGQFPDEVTAGEDGCEGLRAETAPKWVSVVPTQGLLCS